MYLEARRMTLSRVVLTFVLCFVCAGCAGSGAQLESRNSEPVLIEKHAPVYPEEAFSAGLEGTVILQLEIDETGFVVDVVVLGGPPELSSAAVEAARKWKFKPGRVDGNPVAMRIVTPIHFKL